MKDIKITYKWLGLVNFSFSRTAPESWNEVSPKQLISIAKSYLGEEQDNTFVANMLNIPKYITRRLNPFYVFKIIQTFEFISDFKPRDSFVFKRLSCGQAPRHRLSDLSFGRFVFIDTYFYDYAMDESEHSLNKFIACLYWPAKTPFSESLIPKRAAKIAKMDKTFKQAIAINYRLVKDWLETAYPLIFVSGNGKTNSPERKMDSPLLKVFDAIVGDDIINSDKYAQMPLHEVFRYITKKIKENAKRS